MFDPADGGVDVAVEAGDVGAVILVVSLKRGVDLRGKMGENVRSKDAGENVANHAADAVDGKNVKGVIDAS